eukprot:CAMPEP_0174253546 /NCGR_PEP_ID=MMETSP0439-20130205/2913_1 /TAXON_ID=0 /ORGANISM="Stereomyxa ramosa, Strain Chinc5" /LENGTH=362 /DNA_ID=CAMNT_0015334629 /DNA_START=1 /DNA_END=1086 /DNA_ORIENTATION=+
MALSLQGGDDHARLCDLCTYSFKDQAIWFLNSYWDDFGSSEAENVWNAVVVANKTDVNKNGVLDEFEGHRFLEQLNEEMTVLSMRDKLRESGAISKEDRPKTVPLTHYFIIKYNVDWHEMINAPQGSKEEVERAREMLERVQAAFRECEERDSAATAAVLEAKAREAEAIKREDEAKAREADAKAREADAKEREAEARASEADAKAREADARQREAEAKASEADAKQKEADAKEREAQAVADEEQAKQKVAELQVKEEEERSAKAELEAALAELKAQEDAYNSQIALLKKKSTEGGVVSQGKAKNELAQLLSEDPLPLRRAKITLEAAIRRADKATAEAECARTEAHEASEKAAEARREATQ